MTLVTSFSRPKNYSIILIFYFLPATACQGIFGPGVSSNLMRHTLVSVDSLFKVILILLND